MPATPSAASLRKLPEFRALEAVYLALSPLDPEGRRKVIEAIHALLAISAGQPGAASARKAPRPSQPRR